MSGADKSLGLLGSLVKATDGSLLITLASHCILGILGGKPHREVKLRQDESWEDNVNFIKKVVGRMFRSLAIYLQSTSVWPCTSATIQLCSASTLL